MQNTYRRFKTTTAPLRYKRRNHKSRVHDMGQGPRLVGKVRVVHDDQLKQRFFPEANVSGFSHVDGTIGFFNQLAAIVRPTDYVLDFGAGRGEPLRDDSIPHRRNLGSFKGRCRHVDGCDIDPVVLQNPFIDDAKVIPSSGRLPYEDNRFHVIVARHVFEHIEQPEVAARELLRIVKPGGIIAAVTPNKWGYIAIPARIVPNSYHWRVLSRSQPGRKPEDIFPTRYKLNTSRDLRKAFGNGADVFITRKATDPAYHFGKPSLYRILKFVNKHTPDLMLPVLDVYIRKR